MNHRNHHQQMLQPPPLLIHTASYVSNRSASNRSVATSATRGRHRPDSATQGAELIAKATTQARAAAQSILLNGGSQAAALSTAKAAAKSVLLPLKDDGAGKPPIGSARNTNFRNRRKNRQQAEIIASMALVSANEALEYGTMGHDMITVTPGGMRSVYHDDKDSEFPDDYTNYRSLGPGSLHGRSHSVRSHKEIQQLQYPEYFEQTRQTKHIIQPPQALDRDVKVLVPMNDQSHADQATLDFNVFDDKVSVKPLKSSNQKAILSKSPSLKGLFQGIQAPGTVSGVVEQSEATEPRAKIPMEMPMPRSNSIKAFAPLKGTNSNKIQTKNDRNGTPRSRQQLSESQISCYSDHSSVSHTNSYSYAGSTYDEHTADYTRGTFESVVDSTTRRNMNRSSGASFFSTMDPFVRTFSEVFSCNPVPVLAVQKNDSIRRSKLREARDVIPTTQYNSNSNKSENRDQPSPQGPTINILSNAAPRILSNAVPRRSASVDDSILSSNDIPILAQRGAEAPTKESSNHKKKLTSPTMEQLVLRALSAISPKGAASKRPRLNVRPMNQNAGPTTTTAKYRSFNDGSSNAANGTGNNRGVGRDMLKVLSRVSVQSKNNNFVPQKNGANDASIESNSSGNPQQQEHREHQSSSSSEYYISASTDDSANMTSAAEPPLPQGAAVLFTTINPKTNASNINHHNPENKLKRFSKFSFHRSKRTMQGTDME
jgi:hypothetical protein